MFVLFVYGVIRFSDGPISEYQGGYRSTRGVSHTAAEYRDYKSWEKILFIVWPPSLAIGFFVQRMRNSCEPADKARRSWRWPRL
jgi:hypothetical protein